MPKLLAGGGVGQVDLDQPRPAAGDQSTSITHSVGVVRERSRVEHDIGTAVDSLMNPADELSLVIGLTEVDVQSQ